MVRKPNRRSDSKPRPRSEARRLEILRAAARVFRERGYAEAGMREIACAAGLSPANLYYYFAGKHEILFFCQDRSLDRMLAAMDAARLSGAAVPDQLRSVLRAHVLCLLDEIEGAAAHIEVEVLPDDLRESIVGKRDRYERALRRLVARGGRDGALRVRDAKLVTRAMLGALNWTARWFRSDGPRSPAAVADGVVEYLLRGLVAPRSAEAEAAGSRGPA